MTAMARSVASTVARVFLLIAVGAFAIQPARAGAQRLAAPGSAIPAAQPVVAANGMVVAQEARAARIGAEILQKGGNAIDAAVATGFAMAVSYPRAGNIGGGGFMVIHRAERRRHRDRLSRDRAGGDRRQELSRRRRQRGSAEVARLRAFGRRAGHGRRPCARRGKIRLRPFHARRTDRAGDRHGARRHSGQRRYRGFAAGRARPAGALAGLGKNLSRTPRRRARAPAMPGAERSRQHARSHRA